MLASKIACCISKNAVDYSLARIHGEPATKCRLFTDEKYGYASIHQAGIHSSEVRPFLDFYSKIGEEETFREMMVTDALTFNTDRHSGNFGVLFDNDSLEMIRMAPSLKDTVPFPEAMKYTAAFLKPSPGHTAGS